MPIARLAFAGHGLAIGRRQRPFRPTEGLVKVFGMQRAWQLQASSRVPPRPDHVCCPRKLLGARPPNPQKLKK